jgi:hypothetical protein
MGVDEIDLMRALQLTNLTYNSREGKCAGGRKSSAPRPGEIAKPSRSCARIARAQLPPVKRLQGEYRIHHAIGSERVEWFGDKAPRRIVLF